MFTFKRHFLLIMISIFSYGSLFSSFTHIPCKEENIISKLYNNTTRSLAQTIKNSPIFFTIALFTLLFQPDLIQEHPYISAFIGTDLFANFLFNLSAPSSPTNHLAQVVCQHPLSSALIIYALAVDPSLAIDHPFISSFLLGSLAYSWAKTIQETSDRKEDSNFKYHHSIVVL